LCVRAIPTYRVYRLYDIGEPSSGQSGLLDIPNQRLTSFSFLVVPFMLLVVPHCILCTQWLPWLLQSRLFPFTFGGGESECIVGGNGDGETSGVGVKNTWTRLLLGSFMCHGHTLFCTEGKGLG